MACACGSPRLDKEKLALTLFEVGAIQFDFEKGFTLKSGATSPVYVNLRLLRSFPGAMGIVADIFYAMLFDACGGQLPNRLADVPTAITPIVAVMAVKYGIPMITPRIEKKDHGSGQAIDGVWRSGMNVALFDDVVTTAASKLEAAKILEAAGLMINGVFIFVDREQGGLQQLQAAGYKAWAAITLPEILGILLAENKISKYQHDRVMEYLLGVQQILAQAAAADAEAAAKKAAGK